jgi:hypothetical protein
LTRRWRRAGIVRRDWASRLCGELLPRDCLLRDELAVVDSTREWFFCTAGAFQWRCHSSD